MTSKYLGCTRVNVLRFVDSKLSQNPEIYENKEWFIKIISGMKDDQFYRTLHTLSTNSNKLLEEALLEALKQKDKVKFVDIINTKKYNITPFKKGVPSEEMLMNLELERAILKGKLI